MKTWFKILKVIFIIILVLAALIVVWYLWADNAPVFLRRYAAFAWLSPRG